MRQIGRTAAILAALSLLTCTVAAEEISLPLTGDTLINGIAPTENYGDDDFLVVHSYGPKEVLVLFDAATLAGRTVTDARLELFMTDARAGGAIAVHAITSSWDEAAVTFASRPPVEEEPAGLAAVTADEAGTVISIDVTETVQRWAGGTLPAAGFLLTTDEPVRAYFDSRETEGGALPKLIVVADDVPEPPTGPAVLDLSSLPFTIDQPGDYVIDRDWQLPPLGGPGNAITIAASDVALNLNGFDIDFDASDEGVSVRIEGDNVTIRDGSISGGEQTNAIFSVGAHTVLERLEVYSAAPLALTGADSAMTDSRLSGGYGIYVEGPNSTVRSNVVSCSLICLRAEEDARILSNRFEGSQANFLWLVGDRTIFANNVVIQSGADAQYGLIVAANDNLVLDNLFLFETVGYAVFEVNGARNALGDNVATADRSGPRWQTGILFRQDGNFYGSNAFAAGTVADENGTSQVDWGGNVTL